MLIYRQFLSVSFLLLVFFTGAFPRLVFAAVKPETCYEDIRVEQAYKALLVFKADKAINFLTGPLIEALKANDEESRRKAVRYLLLIAHAFQIDDNLVAAADCNLIAMKLDPGNKLAACRAAEALFRSGQQKQAEKIFVQLAKLSDNNPAVLRTLAWHTYLSGSPEQAIQLFERALKIDPSDYQANWKIAIVYHGKGEINKSIKYTRLAAAYASSPYLREICLGVADDRAMNLNSAEQHYLAAGKINADDPDWYQHLGMLHGEANRMSEAERDFRKAVCCSRFSTMAYQRYAICFLVTGHPDQAHQVLDHAQKIRPQSAEIECTRAAVFERAGDVKRAEHSYRQALLLNPYCIAAYRGLIDLPAVQDNLAVYAEVAALWQRNLPFSPSGFLAEASVLRRKKHWNEAIPVYLKAIELLGSSSRNNSSRFLLCKVAAGLGACYYQCKEFDKAFEAAKIFNENKGKPSERFGIPTRPGRVYFNQLTVDSPQYKAARHGLLADILFECEDLSDASAEYQKAIAFEPENIAWHAGLLKVSIDNRNIPLAAKEDAIVAEYVVRKIIQHFFPDLIPNRDH